MVNKKKPLRSRKFTIALGEELDDRLEKYIAEYKTSRAGVIRNALIKFLKKEGF